MMHLFDDSWGRFFSTGKIEDYLSYKRRSIGSMDTQDLKEKPESAGLDTKAGAANSKAQPDTPPR